MEAGLWDWLKSLPHARKKTMRDASRIEPTLSAMAAAWAKAPEMRLGLVLYNAEAAVLILKLQALIAKIEVAS